MPVTIKRCWPADDIYTLPDADTLVGADLSNLDLRHANLYGMDLTGADLSYSDLTGADLSHAIINGTNLTGANLASASLGHTDLTVANLSGATMTLYTRLTKTTIADGMVCTGYWERICHSGPSNAPIELYECDSGWYVRCGDSEYHIKESTQTTNEDEGSDD